MRDTIGRRSVMVVVLLWLATSSVAAQEQELFLPWVSNSFADQSPQIAPRQQADVELIVEPDTEVLPNEDTEIDENVPDVDNKVNTHEPDESVAASEESRYQDGDGPWAEPPDEMMQNRVEGAATNAFDATKWRVQNKLGVGTQTPVHRLEVNHNVNWVSRALIRNNNGGGNVSSDIYLTTGTAKGLMIQKFGSGFNNFSWSGIALADYARIRTDTGVNGLILTTGYGPIYWGTGDTERVRLHANGGMTIRNANPTFGLRIEDGAGDGLLVRNSGSDGIFVDNVDVNGMRIDNAGADGVFVNNPTDYGISVLSPGEDGVYVINPDDNGVQVDGAGSDGIRVNDAGIHGVRVNDAGADGVQVNLPGDDGVNVNCPCGSGNGVKVSGGNIRIVNSGGFIDQGTTLNVPDYVFEEGYPLMSLDELKAFIETEKHLPNVPSEDEIHANGLNLSEFHMRLLEKVEELTLYTLQQEEVIEAQQEQIDALSARLSDLETEQLVR